MSGAAKLELLIELKNKMTAGLNSAKKHIEKACGDMQNKLNAFKASTIKAFGDIKKEVPGLGRAIDLIKNPLVAGAAAAVAIGSAFVKSVKMAEDWREKMAQINVLTEQSPEGLKQLSDKLLEIGSHSANDLDEIPKAFTAIMGALADTDKSLETLEPVLKAAKAGFVDVETAARAATAVMGAAGISGKEALDTIFAAVKNGNVTFENAANYMPKIIPMARGVGISLGETAGAFAQLTKSLNPHSAATALEGVTRALSNQKIAIGEIDRKTGKYVSGFKSLGIEVFDSEGKIRSLVDIVSDLNKKTEGLSDEKKMLMFDKLGLDQSASLGIMSMMQNVDDLKNTIDKVTDSTGQLERAFEDARTPLDTWLEIGNKIKRTFIKFGELFLPVIETVGNGVLSCLNGIEAAGKFLYEWKGVILGIAGALAIFNIKMIAAAVKIGAVAVAKGVATAAQWAWNLAMSANPIGIIITLIGGLIGFIVVAYNKFDSFRAIIQGTWEVIKGFGNILKDFVIDRIKGIISGLGSMGSAIAKLFKGDFKGAWADAKQGVADLSGFTAVKNAAIKTVQLKDTFSSKYNEVLDEAAKKKAAEKTENGDFKDVPVNDNNNNNDTNNDNKTPSDDAHAIKGGSQTKNVTINMGNFLKIDQYNPKSQEINSLSKSDFERWMTEMFMRVVRSVDMI